MVQRITYTPSPEVRVISGIITTALDVMGKGVSALLGIGERRVEEPETPAEQFMDLMPIIVILGGIALIVYLWKK